MKIDEAKNKFLTFCQIEKGLTSITIEDYRLDFLNYEKCFPEIKSVEDISIDDLSNFVIFLSLNGLKTTSIRRKLSTIKSFYSFLEEENLASNIVDKDVSVQKIAKNLPKFLTKNEIQKLLNATKKGDEDVFAYAVLNLLFSSGIRVSELVNLKLKNFKIEEKLLMVTGKGIKDRYVPLRDEAIFAINDYLKKVRNLIPRPLIDKEILFLNKNGRKYNRNSIYYLVRKYASIANIQKEISPHVLRHTFATVLINNGASVRHVQEMLGHKNVSTTEIYTHVDTNRILSTYDLYWDDN
ncbi:MAG: tyrosine-type recombinase/integrase [bacterium]|nr:tyrosine-type recombinase/integrase [bacterium]